MSLLASATAELLEAARRQLAAPAAWPDPPSGFARRLLQAAALAPPPALEQALRPADASVLRRAPDLAGFGYLVDRADAATQAEWLKAFDRLRGREIFPADRNSFIHTPLELIGVAYGLRDHPSVDPVQARWLGDAVLRGFSERQFLTTIARTSAVTAARLLGRGDVATDDSDSGNDLAQMSLTDLTFIGALALLAPNGAAASLQSIEAMLARRLLLEPIAIRDTAEAAGVFVLLQRAVNRAALGTSEDSVERVVSLCKRLPMFVERLQKRQRSRVPIEVKDEYDVQDLLHAILKLHFEDVRPEEWAPSYAANSSRTDFFLPAERLVIEAKMTRANLGQREVVNELIIDRVRYEKMPTVDHLVCVVYDPDRRCGNPAAVATDVEQSDGRLKVTVVVTPRGA